MFQTSHTFRIFVSSTFSDLKAERNALQERVFPRLQELAAAHNCRFQAIDLRWGIFEEAALDQRTMKICLGEIERCQKVSPRLNFIFLLGERYGWRPLPVEIPVNEFEKIYQLTTSEGKGLLKQWYRRDDNAIPPAYLLQPRSEKYVHYDKWEKVEETIRQIFQDAIQKLSFAPKDTLKYTASATEQEIFAGALNVPNAQEHVFGFFRKIENIPQDKSSEGFGELDANAAKKQQELIARLKEHFPHNIHEYKTRWQEEGLSQEHLAPLCEDVYTVLSKIIVAESEKLKTVDHLESEINAHENFGKDHARIFIGRDDILQAISNHIARRDIHPLVVCGESGCGKSALMAKAVERAQEYGYDVMYRFIGATPKSSNVRALLENLCRQLSRRYEADETGIPFEYRELVGEFHKRLALATKAKPIILFLDALDQLSDIDNARNLSWLPFELPENVHLVVSTLPGQCLDVLEARLPKGYCLDIQPMSVGDGKIVLCEWFKTSNRKLQDNQEKYVLSKFKACRLPLYLKLVFEEARLWKSYDPLPKLSDDVPGILRDLFKRLSLESNHGEMLVSRSLGYLHAARNGLSEDDLLIVLSANVAVYERFLETAHHVPPQLVGLMAEYAENEAVPMPDHMTVEYKAEELLLRMHTNRAILNSFVTWLHLSHSTPPRLPTVLWSRLNSDLEPYLVSREVDGESLLNFHHQLFRKIAGDELQSTEADQLNFHHQLADHFWNQAHKGWAIATASALRELPYQLLCALDWARLEELFFTPGYVESITHRVAVSGDARGQNRYDGVLELIGDLKMAERTLRSNDGSLAKRISHNLQALLEILIDRIELIRRFPDVACQEIGNYLAGGSTQLGNLFKTHMRGKLTLSTVRGTMSPKRTHSAAITALAIPENGEWFIAGSADGTVGCWHVGQLEPDWFKQHHKAWVTSTGISPSGKSAITGSDDGMVLTWNVETGESNPAPVPPAVALFDGLWNQVRFCAYADNESIIVLRGVCCTKVHVMSGIEVWNSAQVPPVGQRIPTRPHICDYVPGLQICLSASGGPEGVSICDMSDGSVIRTIPTAGVTVECALNPNGTLAAAVDAQGRMTIYNMHNEEPTAARFDRPLAALCSAGENAFFACDIDGIIFRVEYASGRVKISGINVATPLPLSSLPNIMRFLPTLNSLIIGTQQGKLIALDIQTLTTVSEWGQTSTLVYGALSENGKSAVGITGNLVAGERINGNGMVLVDEKGEAKIKTQTPHKQFITAAAVAPNGDCLSVDRSGRAIAWQFPKSVEVYDLDLGPLVSCQYWDEGRQFVCSSIDGTIITQNGTIYRSGEDILVTTLAAAGKPLLWVVGCADGSVRCYLDGGQGWNEQLDKTGALEVSKVTISKSCAWIAAGDINGSVSVWDSAGNLTLHKPRLHNGAVSSLLIDEMRGVVFSAGYDRILIGSGLHSGKVVFITTATVHILSLCPGQNESLIALDAQGRILEYMT